MINNYIETVFFSQLLIFKKYNIIFYNQKMYRLKIYNKI